MYKPEEFESATIVITFSKDKNCYFQENKMTLKLNWKNYIIQLLAKYVKCMNLVVVKCENLGKTFHSKNLLSAQIPAQKMEAKIYIFYNIYFSVIALFNQQTSI
jgi:hypothetical protein